MPPAMVGPALGGAIIAYSLKRYDNVRLAYLIDAACSLIFAGVLFMMSPPQFASRVRPPPRQALSSFQWLAAEVPTKYAVSPPARRPTPSTSPTMPTGTSGERRLGEVAGPVLLSIVGVAALALALALIGAYGAYELALFAATPFLGGAAAFSVAGDVRRP